MGQRVREYRSIAESLCSTYSELSLVSAMYPMQPDALLREILMTAVARGTRSTVYGADLTGRFSFIEEDWLRDGIVRLVTIGGRVSKRVAPFADFVPCSLYEISRRLEQGVIDAKIFVGLAGPVGPTGFHSLGPSIAYSASAAKGAETIVLQLSSSVPILDGYPGIHSSEVTLSTEVEALEIPEFRAPTLNDRSIAIGAFIAQLIPNGATLQLGIGSIPEAFIKSLSHHRDLGIHSGAIPEGAADLIRSGVFNGSRKIVDVGEHVTTSLLGSRDLYDFAKRPENKIKMQPVAVTHAPMTLGSIPGLFAINSALEVDVTGQVNAETLNGRRVSSAGGQIDFMRAAHLSDGGASIMAIPAMSDGTSRIVGQLSNPASVTTMRNDVDYVVTEFGIADLRGRTVTERTRAIARIADPAARSALAVLS